MQAASLFLQQSREKCTFGISVLYTTTENILKRLLVWLSKVLIQEEALAAVVLPTEAYNIFTRAGLTHTVYFAVVYHRTQRRFSPPPLSYDQNFLLWLLFTIFLSCNSPLFAASMMELTKPPRSAAAGRNKDPLIGDGDDEEEAPGGIANMRVVNASKVMGPAAGAIMLYFLTKLPSEPPQ